MGGEEKEAMKLTPSSWKDRGVLCVRLGGWRGRLRHPGLSGLGGTEAGDVCLTGGVVEAELVCEAQRLDEILQKRILSPKMPQCAGSEEELGKRCEG